MILRSFCSKAKDVEKRLLVLPWLFICSFVCSFVCLIVCLFLCLFVCFRPAREYFTRLCWNNIWGRFKSTTVEYKYTVGSRRRLYPYQALCFWHLIKILQWCVVHAETLLSVTNLSSKSDTYDVYPACHCVRIQYLVLVGGRCFPNSLHAYRKNNPIFAQYEWFVKSAHCK